MRLILFFSILVISCGTNTLNYKIIIDSSDQILTKNSNIKLSVSEIDNKDDVSISFFLNDQVIDSKTNLNLARLGANEIVAEIIDSESNYIISKKIDIYSAYPPSLYSYKIINEYSHDISSYT